MLCWEILSQTEGVLTLRMFFTRSMKLPLRTATEKVKEPPIRILVHARVHEYERAVLLDSDMLKILLTIYYQRKFSRLQ
jgi:hypothetical protein